MLQQKIINGTETFPEHQFGFQSILSIMLEKTSHFLDVNKLWHDGFFAKIISFLPKISITKFWVSILAIEYLWTFVNSETSNEFPIKAGVHQGPFLYNVVTFDFPIILSTKTAADDITIFSCDTNTNTSTIKLLYHLTLIENWHPILHLPWTNYHFYQTSIFF